MSKMWAWSEPKKGRRITTWSSDNIFIHRPIILRIEKIFHCKIISHVIRMGFLTYKWARIYVNPNGFNSHETIENMWTHKYKDEVWGLWLNIDMDGVNPYSLQILFFCVQRYWFIKIFPPWLFMKNENPMLAIIFLDEKHMNIIDVYLLMYV